METLATSISNCSITQVASVIPGGRLDASMLRPRYLERYGHGGVWMLVMSHGGRYAPQTSPRHTDASWWRLSRSGVCCPCGRLPVLRLLSRHLAMSGGVVNGGGVSAPPDVLVPKTRWWRPVELQVASSVTKVASAHGSVWCLGGVPWRRHRRQAANLAPLLASSWRRWWPAC